METTVPVAHFPIENEPMTYRFAEIRSVPGGVGFNLATALRTRGNDITLVSFVGDDAAGRQYSTATALFMCHENLPVEPETWSRQLWQTYGTTIRERS